MIPHIKKIAKWSKLSFKPFLDFSLNVEEHVENYK